jgi:cell division protein FtsW (lipid II flippase)
LQSFILKFLIPLILAVAVFGALMVYRSGWDAMTRGGTDVWGLLFEALGGAIPPVAVGLVVAGLIKLFNRSVHFLNAYLVVFLIAFAVFAVSYLTVARYERNSAVTGHFESARF